MPVLVHQLGQGVGWYAQACSELLRGHGRRRERHDLSSAVPGCHVGQAAQGRGFAGSGRPCEGDNRLLAGQQTHHGFLLIVGQRMLVHLPVGLGFLDGPGQQGLVPFRRRLIDAGLGVLLESLLGSQQLLGRIHVAFRIVGDRPLPVDGYAGVLQLIIVEHVFARVDEDEVLLLLIDQKVRQPVALSFSQPEAPGEPFGR